MYCRYDWRSIWREAMAELRRWHDDLSRKPMVVSGVRQCGKTYLLKEFGSEAYEDVLYVDLERSKNACKVFDRDLDPSRILEDLSAVFGTTTKPGSTLVILDEIQSCPAAIASLKHFCEEMRDLHIVGAGSLPGAEKASYPVGKVDRLVMRPMNFREWLVANGRSMLYERADEEYPNVSDALLGELNEEYRRYLFVGGMPEAVQTWIDTHDESAVAKVQDGILNSYAADFLKHVPNDMAMKVHRVWTSIPVQLAKENGRFYYSSVEASGRGRGLDDAVSWLESANLVHRVVCTEKPSIPLAASADASRFKLYVCDCGLLSRMSDARLAAYLYDSLDDATDSSYRGAVAENYVLNEIVSSFGREPFYWRDGKYEVDFLIQTGHGAAPIEVKSGTKVRATSLKFYIDRFSPEKAIVLSRNPPKEGTATSIPPCMAWKLKDVAEGTENGTAAAPDDSRIVQN